MDSSSVLHPYRKRKFFYELAELLGEAAPVIRHAEEIVVAEEAVCSSNVVLSESAEEESSVEYVEFDGLQDALSGHSGSSRQTLPSQGSVYESSTQDSACLVPMSDNTVAALGSSAATGVRHFGANAVCAVKDSSDGQAAVDGTQLVNGDIVHGKPLLATDTTTELSDYFDGDRLCELTPCWLFKERSQCNVHRVAVACPMLLFCLQVMDEFVAFHTFHRQETWRVNACKVAQCVFVARWEAHLRSVGGNQEIDLQLYVQRKATLVGVAHEVWRLVSVYWDKYKQNYLHHQELCFTDVRADHVTRQNSKWSCMRDHAHIYGMKTSQASRVAELADLSASFTSPFANFLSVKHLADLVASESPRISPLRFGIEYLDQVQSSSAAMSDGTKAKQQQQLRLREPVHRHVVSQSEWKVAFNAIEIHLQKWDPRVRVFPCGSFSRGAAFGSTVDILVAVPDAPSAAALRSKTRRKAPRAAASSRHDEVIAALTSAKIVHKAKEHRVSPGRSLFVVPYKKVSLILDLKVYELPQSWFALVYFTGPQSFAHAFFSALLSVSLRELCEASFAAVYAKAVEVLGPEKLAAVACEEDVFRLAGWEYLLPSFRM